MIPREQIRYKKQKEGVLRCGMIIYIPTELYTNNKVLSTQNPYWNSGKILDLIPTFVNYVTLVKWHLLPEL